MKTNEHNDPMRMLTILSFFFSFSSCGHQNALKKIEKNCYPEQPVAKIVILVADTAILGEGDIPANDTTKTYSIFPGIGFVKADGTPVHKPLKRVILNSGEQEEFLSILRPLPEQHEGDATSCFPFFRHVVLFYDKEEKLIGQMHICFDCQQVRFRPNPTCLDFFENHRLGEVESFFKSIDIPMFHQNRRLTNLD